MNTKKIFILSFLLFIIFNSLNSINIYKNDEHGIYFEYPDEIIFGRLSGYNTINKYSDKASDINEKYILNVQITIIKNSNEEEILKKFIKDASKYKTIYELIKYNGRIIGEKVWGYLGINQIEVNQYYVWFNIVKDGYYISIGLTYYDLYTQIPPRYPDYFKKDDIYNEWVFKWDEKESDIPDKFFNLAFTHSDKAATELVKLYDYANIIEKSLKLYGKIFNPKISNLIFREKQGINSKPIRLLDIKEKLELLEKGKEETINGTKGTWVKVKTEKGEVGWCFDAYLEPYDDVKKK